MRVSPSSALGWLISQSHHGYRWIKVALVLAVLLCPAVIPLGAQSISIAPISPYQNQIVADSVSVWVNVSATYELSVVRATIGTLATNLAFRGGYWSNRLDTTSLLRGSYTVTIFAQDVFGNTGQVQRLIKVDRPPVVNVAAPLNGTVARSNLSLSISASDDDPAGVRIDVYHGPGGTLLVSSNNSIQRTIAAVFPGIYVEATDSSNQKTVVRRTVYVETSSNLVEGLHAPGPLLDFAGPRLLYASIPDPPLPPTGQLLDISTGKTIQGPALWSIYPIPGEYYMPTSGWVSANSAVIIYDTPYIYGYVLALQGTNFSVVAYTDYPYPSDILDGVAILGNQLFDFNKGTNGCLPYMGQAPSSPGYRSLGPNEIVFVDTNGVFRSRATNPDDVCSPREITQVTTRLPAFRLISDGTNVVFHHHGEVFANVNGTDELLAVWTTSDQDIQYLANSGWIAFTKPGTMSQRQIWTRSPSGQLEQRTFFSGSSVLESLNGDGALTFYIGSGPAPGRYLSVPAAQPVWINSGQGRVKWEENTPYIILGRSALRIKLGKLAIQPLGGQAFRLELRSPNGLRHVIQQSSDLSFWSDIATITNTQGIFSFTNTSGNLSTFYRAVLKP